MKLKQTAFYHNVTTEIIRNVIKISTLWIYFFSIADLVNFCRKLVKEFFLERHISIIDGILLITSRSMQLLCKVNKNFRSLTSFLVNIEHPKVS